jgi:hypothetical protein
MLGWLSAMRHSDAVLERAHNVIVKILQQHRYQAIFGELLTENRLAHEQAQHVAPSFGHSRPERTTDPMTNRNSPQMPPTDWYGGPCTAITQPDHGIFNTTPIDPQLLSDLGHPHPQHQTLP